MRMLTLIGLLLLVGCARFNTKQYDKRYNERGEMATEISTKATATALFSSKQLANWKASQTEKSQGATVGVEQQGATNAIAALNAIAEIVRAAGGLAK